MLVQVRMQMTSDGGVHNKTNQKKFNNEKNLRFTYLLKPIYNHISILSLNTYLLIYLPNLC
jgi:hypothetical protein